MTQRRRNEEGGRKGDLPPLRRPSIIVTHAHPRELSIPSYYKGRRQSCSELIHIRPSPSSSSSSILVVVVRIEEERVEIVHKTTPECPKVSRKGRNRVRLSGTRYLVRREKGKEEKEERPGNKTHVDEMDSQRQKNTGLGGENGPTLHPSHPRKWVGKGVLCVWGCDVTTVSQSLRRVLASTLARVCCRVFGEKRRETLVEMCRKIKVPVKLGAGNSAGAWPRPRRSTRQSLGAIVQAVRPPARFPRDFVLPALGLSALGFVGFLPFVQLDHVLGLGALGLGLESEALVVQLDHPLELLHGAGLEKLSSLQTSGHSVRSSQSHLSLLLRLATCKVRERGNSTQKRIARWIEEEMNQQRERRQRRQRQSSNRVARNAAHPPRKGDDADTAKGCGRPVPSLCRPRSPAARPGLWPGRAGVFAGIWWGE